MKKISVIFFANLKERAGISKIAIDIDDEANISSLTNYLCKQYPSLEQALVSCVYAINHQFAFADDFIPDNAEVAIFPPVSGGRGVAESNQAHPQTMILLTEDEINLNALLERVSLPTTGAACFFIGMVRGVTDREEMHETIYLEYEAYKPMAEEKMRQISDEIRQHWPAVEGIALVQRLGRLNVCSPTVAVVCTAGHRDEGVFEAARYGIDRLKEIVPVWKKEVGPMGESWIEGGYYPQRGD